jgi:hypothetical protein
MYGRETLAAKLDRRATASVPEGRMSSCVPTHAHHERPLGLAPIQLHRLAYSVITRRLPGRNRMGVPNLPQVASFYSRYSG